MFLRPMRVGEESLRAEPAGQEEAGVGGDGLDPWLGVGGLLPSPPPPVVFVSLPSPVSPFLSLCLFQEHVVKQSV